MGREIKFRIWDGERYWYNVAPLNDNKALTQELTSDECCFEYDNQYVTRKGDVEQFTGLVDTNGEEIYEGDIVRVSDEIALNDDICVNPTAKIVWVDSAAGFGEKFMIKKAPMLPIGLYKYEVIGDIHENPELLEGEE